MKIAFVGLGSMGAAMARNLIAAGHGLTVWNRTAATARELEAAGAKVAATAAEAAKDAELLITMLADDPATDDVLFGTGGVADALPTGVTHVAMSTLSPAFSETVAKRHEERGQGYVAAPVFGRPVAAAARKLNIVVAGEPALVEKLHPVFEALGERVFVVGDQPAAAHTMKLVGNFLIATMIEAMGEALALARKSGLQSNSTLEIINALFQSPRITNYGRQIIDEKFEPAGFKLRLGLKDTRLIAGAADAQEVPMPLASLLHDRFLAGVAQGFGDKDWSFVGQLVAKEAGL